jgi:hypothetical protein
MFARATPSTLVALAAAACLCAAAADGEPSAAQMQTYSAGAVSATLSFDGAPSPGATIVNATGARLQITRGGVVAFDQPIPDVVCDGCELLTGDRGNARVVDLDGDGEPEVLVNSRTGGNECCITLGIYGFAPATGDYDKLVRTFGVADANGLRDFNADGRLEVITDDPRFVGRFGSAAESWPPPVYLDYERRGGAPALVDVTRRFPAQIRRDAALAKTMFTTLKPGGASPRAALAGYVADEELLGRGAVGLAQLDRQAARHRLGSPAQARAFRVRLLRLLHTYGYR